MAGIKTIGVLLLNLGGPDSLSAVKPFLYNLFSDRKIIKLGPSFLQKPIAWFIAFTRSKKTVAMYRLIGGRSPILAITQAQADALEKALNESRGRRTPALHFKVYVAMRYWHPLIGDVVERMCNDGVRDVVAVSLYPHYSLATSGSALGEFGDVIRRCPVRSSCISSWYDHPLYIAALVEAIKRGLGSFAASGTPAEDVHVLFSAHSLPRSIVEAGDPYVSHIRATIAEVVKKTEVRWHLSFQSKSGPVKWLEPSTEETLRELAKKGVRNLLVVPISFVSDHIEPVYAIDRVY
ncbi:MAG: ferrochelatase, partial [Nitrospirae bacterium]|nr:ferrochelatase [Nitrospirota bacterium]